MGTWYSVRLGARPAGLDPPRLQADIEARLDRVNAWMSTYRPDSEISRFNRYEGTDWFPVSAETEHVVQAALEVSRLTDGAFDVTVAPLVDLWSFGPETREPRVPSEEEIARRRARVGYRQFEVRRAPPALRKTRPDLMIDLSAIAKGFGVDQVAELLEEAGIRHWLVEIGGDVRARGVKSDQTAWRIGVEKPLSGRREVQLVLEIGRRAVATSGDYRNFFEVDGKRYGHTIDPRTGRPVEHGLGSVTVVEDTCMSADALATALMVLGPAKGYDLAVARGWSAMFQIRGERGLEIRQTPAFAALRTGTPDPESEATSR
jgi:thiamine biosynthesis lipoprotein